MIMIHSKNIMMQAQKGVSITMKNIKVYIQSKVFAQSTVK